MYKNHFTKTLYLLIHCEEKKAQKLDLNSFFEAMCIDSNGGK